MALLLVLLVLMVLMGVRAENVGIRWIVVRFTRKAEDQSRTKGFESKEMKMFALRNNNQ
jgi:hypothetical protein